MIISGLDKLTLLDYPDHIACIIFTGGCNFRCPFCHNFELVHESVSRYESAYILDFLEKRKSRLEAVVISGGEPCIHNDLPTFLSNIKSLGYLIKLDTNGCYPDMIKTLTDRALIDYIAMDIKAPVYSVSDPSFSVLSKNTGIKNPNAGSILESIRLILTSGLEHEFRTTVTKELLSADDLIDIAKMIPGAHKYFIQSFRPGISVPNKNLSPYPAHELESILARIKRILPETYLR